LQKAFWIQNLVSNFAYSRWADAYPILRKKIDSLHTQFAQQVKEVDNTAVAAYHSTSSAAAVDIVTDFSVLACEKLQKEWVDFFGELFTRFRDFSTIVPKADDTRCGCTVQQPGISEGNKRRIVLETGSHYEIPDEAVIGIDRDFKTTY